MTALTDILSFDESVPMLLQPSAVNKVVFARMAEPPTAEQRESCCGDDHHHSRPIKQVWTLGDAEIVQVTEYACPPDSGAFMAIKSLSLTLRPRLV